MLRTAPVQTFLAHSAANYLSKQLNTEVTIGGFRLNWFLEAVITDIKILDKHNHVLLQANKIRADVKFIDLKKRHLTLNAIALTNADVNLIQYKTDSSLNLQFIIDYFASPVVDTTYSEPWLLQVDNAKLIGSHFAFRDERYMKPGKGIDFSDMDFSQLNLEVKNISFQGDSILADIKQFTCKEKSGFRLDDFTTQAIACPRGISAKNLQLTTENSRLSMDMKFEYDHWNAFNYFLDSIRIKSAIKPSQLDMRDIVYFAPDIAGMADIFDLSGNIKGTVSSFTAKDFHFAFGKHTSFKGNITMNGLPDIAETFINLKTDEFYTNVSDVQSFTLPYSEGSNKIVLPDALTKLGNVSVNGRFTGFYNDFVSKATFVTDVGQITTDILLTNNKATDTHEYNGEILVKEFNAGKILNVTQLGTVNLYANIKGKNFSLDKADLTMKGEITDLQYEGNTIGLINIDGEFRHKRFTGGVYVNDELLALNFLGSADFSAELPAFDFKANIAHANLAKLNLMTNDSTVLLSTSTDFRFQGNTIDNLMGALHFSNTSFTMGHKTLRMNDLSVSTTSLPNGGKRMQVNSDFVNAVFSGQYTFDDMADYLKMVFTEFLPSLSQSQKLPVRLNRGSFDYTIQLHHTDSLTEMFLPWIKINTQTVISGTFDPGLGLVNVNGRSPLIVLSGISMRNWTLTGSTENKSLAVRMDCSQIDMSESSASDSTFKRIEQFRLKAVASDDSVKFGISWDDRKVPDHNKGDITGAISFKQNPQLLVRLDKAVLMINDTVWKSIPNNLLTFDNSFIEARNLGFTNNDRHIILNGTVSADPLSQMVLDIKDFNISHLDMLWQSAGIDLDGYIDGKVNLSEMYSVPRVSADITIKDFGFNHEELGDAAIKTSWDNENKALAINMKVVYVGNAGTHYPIKVIGNIYPEREHENFDLKADVDNLKVKTIEPFLKGIFSRMRGYTSGALTLTGDFSDPVIKGSVKLMRTELLVDYLRTSYSFTGDYHFDKDKMWFKNIELRDSTFGKGIATGTIYHKAFSDIALDIEVKADNLAALNTTYSPNEIYYGRAKASGIMTLKGSVDDLVLKADVNSEKGTSVVIPISFSRSISENNFIRYRKHGDADKDAKVTQYEPSVLSLQLGLAVKRNADLSIILPYNMGSIDVRGDGLINLGIDTRGEYSMYGNYIMDNGTFLFNFENILKKNFQIQKGGSITFNGSPYDATIQLKAVYKVKTSLAGLPELSTEDKSKRINVNCIISLSNDLYNPDIKFSIDLPDATEEIKRTIFSIIDTTNTLAMNQQMISLLVLNTFSSSSGITSAGASLGFSSYEIVSAQLSRMLSQISKDFDIGVNYRPGDQISPQELELALSTQLFDNRVTIDGAVGMNTYSNTTQQVIGDVLVEVKITEDGRFRFKAFNRTNTGSEVLYSTYSPYTQGVGIVFRKEFNGLKDLFKRSKKAKVPDKKAARKD
ncbi:MAG: translocation/assembly module TamB domain-containing protein [Bacteroidales bacterium]|nr:translocation/assembly module TamB domain-containing protein [Bacteroidales bacterium]